MHAIAKPIRLLADQTNALAKEYKDVNNSVVVELIRISSLLHELARKIESNGTI